MDYNENIFRMQYPLVADFLYHSICYREFYDAYKAFSINDKFWIYTIDAHYLQAVILWCMVFGADGCNPTHWKNLSKLDSENLKESFREGLYKKTSLDEKSFSEYWKSMNDFRGGYAAHRELNFRKPTPIINTAQEVAFFYDDWIREVICPDSLALPPLRKEGEKITAEAKKLALHYMSEVKSLNKDTEQQL